MGTNNLIFLENIEWFDETGDDRSRMGVFDDMNKLMQKHPYSIFQNLPRREFQCEKYRLF